MRVGQAGVPMRRASLSMEIVVGDGMTRPSVIRVDGRDTWAEASWGDRGPHEYFNCADWRRCQAAGPLQFDESLEAAKDHALAIEGHAGHVELHARVGHYLAHDFVTLGL